MGDDPPDQRGRSDRQMMRNFDVDKKVAGSASGGLSTLSAGAP